MFNKCSFNKSNQRFARYRKSQQKQSEGFEDPPRKGRLRSLSLEGTAGSSLDSEIPTKVIGAFLSSSLIVHPTSVTQRPPRFSFPKKHQSPTMPGVRQRRT